MYQKRFDYSKCNSCMKCEKICCNSRVIKKNSDGYPEFKDNQRCIYCGHCLAICQQGAISIEFTPLSGTYFAEPKKLDCGENKPIGNEILEFLRSSRTNRFFLDKPVEKQKIMAIIDCMVRSPSAGNEQNRDYIIIDGKEKIEKLEQLVCSYFAKMMKAYKSPVFSRILSFLGALPTPPSGQIRTSSMPNLSFKQRYKHLRKLMNEDVFVEGSPFSYLRNAGTIIVITSNLKIGSAIHKPFYRGDVCIAATYGILAAKAIGLDSCWMGLLQIAAQKDKNTRSFLKIEKSERLDGAIALGYSDLQWVQMPPRGPAKVSWI